MENGWYYGEYTIHVCYTLCFSRGILVLVTDSDGEKVEEELVVLIFCKCSINFLGQIQDISSMENLLFMNILLCVIGLGLIIWLKTPWGKKWLRDL